MPDKECTKAQLKEISILLHRYFTDDVMHAAAIAYRRLPGDQFKAYDYLWASAQMNGDNRRAAAKAYFEYLDKNKVRLPKQGLTIEERAMIYDSGAIY